MKTFIIIQARLSSTRLPKKVLLPLCDRTVLEVLLERLEKFKEHIIIATTENAREIVELCKKNGVNYFQGSTSNVLERYFESAKHFGAKESDLILRITSDCPFQDPQIVEKLINLHQNNTDGYSYVDIHSSYPRGFDVEAFSFKALKEAYEQAQSAYEKEHVTPYIRSHASEILSLKDDEDNSHFRLTLDTHEDYEFTQELYKKLDCDLGSYYAKIIQTLKENPHIVKINEHIEQKKYHH